MSSHPDAIHTFDDAIASQIRAAISSRSAKKLRAQLEKVRHEPTALAAIAAMLRIDDRLIVLHEDAAREKKRDEFLSEVHRWGEEVSDEPFTGALAGIIDQTAVIEAGYRLISQSIDALPISRRLPERQLAALYHRAAQDFDEAIKREPRFLPASDGVINMGGQVVIERADGSYTSVDAMTDSLTALLGNCITFLAYGRWTSEEVGLDVPLLPLPTSEEIAETDHLLILSLGWVRWQRWERQARYWGGTLRRLEGADLPPEVARNGIQAHFEQDRGEADYFDWVAVERLKQLTAQDLHKLGRDWKDLPLEAAKKLPPDGFLDLAERLAANLVFGGAHLDADDTTTFGGATINEWLRGYSVLRRIAGDALKKEPGVGRHLLRFSRTELAAQLIDFGLSSAGAEAFIKGATFKSDSIDLFDAPLVRQGPDDLLLFGPTAANIDAGRTLLSNLPNLGHSLDHKGARFEEEVVGFFRMIRAPVFAPSRSYDEEPYQIDALLHWGSYLFLFECKNTAPSNLNPKIALDFEQRRIEDIAQVKRLVRGLQAHPDLLTGVGGPDPTGKTIVPVLLYAMPFAKPGTQDGVYSTDWSVLTRFFERADLGIETEFGTGVDSAPLRHRQVTERIWAGERPTVEDFLKVLEQPWPLTLIEAQTQVTWVETNLAPYKFARSVDYVKIDLSRAEIAELYGLDLRRWEKELKQMERQAARVARKNADREVTRQTRLGRKKRP